jgi:hypothetical protein
VTVFQHIDSETLIAARCTAMDDDKGYLARHSSLDCTSLNGYCSQN